MNDYNPKQPRTQYSSAQRNMVRYLFETEGESKKVISEKTNIHVNVIRRWCQKNNWIQGKNEGIIQLTELEARREKAQQLGLGEVDQLSKAKELMEAGVSHQVTVTNPETGKMTTVSKMMPDYKVQNEGLKRAMELTGTRIERKEIEHKGRQEIVHRYEMPQKIKPE